MIGTTFHKSCALYFLRCWQAISKAKLINWSAGVIKSKGTTGLFILKNQLLSPYFLFGTTFAVGFFAILYLKVLSAIHAFYNISGAVYLVSNSQSAWLLFGFIVLVLALVFFLILQQQAALGKHILTASAWICGIAPLVIFCADLLWMLMGLKGQAATVTFSDMFFSNYCRQEWWLYLLLIVLTVFFLLGARIFTYKKEKENLSKKAQNFLLLAPFITPLIFLPYVINTLVFLNGSNRDFSELKGGGVISLGYLIIVMMLGLGIKIIHRYYKTEKGWFIKLTRVAAVSAALAFTVVLLALLLAYKEVMVRNGFFGWQGTQFISQKIVSHFWEFLPSIIVLIGSLILHCYFKHLQFSEENYSGRVNSDQ